MSKHLYNTFKKEEIEELYINQKIPLSLIAQKFGVSHKTMKRFFVENNINIEGRVSSNEFLRNADWLREQYTSGRGLQKIANLANSTRGNVYYALRKFGISLRKGGEKNIFCNRIQDGITGANYKGGRRNAGAKGRYIQILSHGHPFTDKDGYVMEHRLVMEKKLGRYLDRDEIVHHLDGNGHNNDISNLQLTTRKKHFTDHFDAVKEVDRLKKLLTENGICF